jgi:hypothetical protein
MPCIVHVLPKPEQHDALPYVYRWDRQGRKGQRCAVPVRGSMNSCLVVFADGYAMVTSRNAIMKPKPIDKA